MFRIIECLHLSVLNFRVVRRGKMGAYLGLDGRRGDAFWF
jgi:hypothetical protein